MRKKSGISFAAALVAVICGSSAAWSARPVAVGDFSSSRVVCEEQARKTAAASWYCDGVMLYGDKREQEGKVRSFTSRLGKNSLVQSTARSGSIVASPSMGPEALSTKVGSGVAASRGYDTYCTDGHCEYPDPPFRYRLDDRMYYGTKNGTIGKIQRQLKVGLNGRQPRYQLYIGKLETEYADPSIDAHVEITCWDTNGSWIDTKCGESDEYTHGWTSAHWSPMINGNKLYDDSDYYGRYAADFLARGYRNPSYSDGRWRTPTLTSHSWSCSRRWSSSTGQCRFPS